MPKKIKITALILYFIIINISCSSDMELLIYSDIEKTSQAESNTIIYRGVKASLPEDWLFLPAVGEDKIFKFISNDGNKAGMLEIFEIEKKLEEERPDEGNSNTNENEGSEDPFDNSVPEGDNPFTNDDTAPKDNEAANDDTAPKDNEATNDDTAPKDNEAANDDIDWDEEPQGREMPVEIKPLNEYMEELLAQKNNYTYAWYLKRADDKASGYLSKIIDVNADFVYYAYFLDDNKELKRIIRLVMIEKNLNKPSGSANENKGKKVDKETLKEINKDFINIFDSIDFNYDESKLEKLRYGVSISLNSENWQPVFDDSNHNVFLLKHSNKPATAQLRKLGYKQNIDKQKLIKLLIQHYKNDHTGYTYEESNITLDGSECSRLIVKDFVDPVYPNKAMVLNKIFFVHNNELYELAISYDTGDEGLSESLNEILNGIKLNEKT